VTHGENIILSVRLTGDRHVAPLTVHDQGEMNPAFLAHAAERFRQDKGSRTGPGAGPGLSG